MGKRNILKLGCKSDRSIIIIKSSNVGLGCKSDGRIINIEFNYVREAFVRGIDMVAASIGKVFRRVVDLDKVSNYVIDCCHNVLFIIT